MKRRFFAILLTLSMVLSLLPSPAAAAAPEEEHTHALQTDIPAQEQPAPTTPEESADPVPLDGVSGTITNPLYGEAEDALGGVVYAPRYYSGGASAQSDYLTEDADVLEVIASGLEQRKEAITFSWKVSDYGINTDADLENLLLTAFFVSMAHTGEPARGDYLALSFLTAQYGLDEGSYYEDGYYYLEVVYLPTYYTTAQQEAALTAKLEEVMASFGFTAETDDYTKIKTIYDYICANVVYDYANLEDEAYTLKFTAYAALINGTAVCQGYAMLLYRMLLMAGIDNRIILGDHEGVGHAWNIVALDNFYYNVDSTWDAGRTEYAYFLKCPANFPEHTRDSEFETTEFHIYYPMAPADYVPGENPVIASGTCGEGVRWVLGKDGVLTVSGTGAMEDYASISAAPWYGYRDYILGVVVESGVTRVGKNAFYDYPRLQAVSCAATTIGEYAFCENRALLAVDLLEGVEEVGKCAFYYCKNLTAVSVPTSMKRFDERAFDSCDALQAVFITDLAAWCGIEFVPYYQYGKNWYYSNPLCGNADLYLNETPLTELVVPKEVTAISAGAFYCANFTSAILHDDVTEVGAYAFYAVPLTSLTLSKKLEAIKAFSFSALQLTTLVIPEGVTRLEANAFENCRLKELHLPASITQIAYQGLSVEEVHITDVAAWCNIEFPSVTANPLRNNVELYLNGQKVTHLVIPEGVTEIKDYAFPAYGGILKVTFPDSVVSIGKQAFCYSSVSEVNWSENLETIGYQAFMNAKLKKLDLPDRLQRIETEAFANNAELAEISFGAGDLAIGISAFSYCSALEELTLPASVKTIERNAFSNCRALKKLTIGSGIKTIPSEAFSFCTDLVEIAIGESVERIEQSAFYYCTNLKTLEFPASLKELGSGVFRNCKDLGKFVFTGDAPQFTEQTFNGIRQYNRSITIFYPCNNATWTPDVLKSYGHTETEWMPNHVCENGICTLCGAAEIIMSGRCGTGAYWTLDAEGNMSVNGGGIIYESPIPASQEHLVKTLIVGAGITGIWTQIGSSACENLDTVIFQGGAPIFVDNAFYGLTATAYYPANNATWAENVRQNYGGNITWVAACTNGHTEVPVIGYGPTCTEPGLTDGTKCSVCDEPIVAQQPIEAPGHVEVPVIGYGPTCTEPGLTDGTKCTTCGEMVVEQQPIESPGHTEVPVIGYGATCTEPGLTDGVKCTTCGETLVPQEPIEATGHTEVPVIGYGATCTEPGLTDGTKCSVCDEPIVAQEPIEATGHTEVPVIGYGPTCTEPGLTDGTKCSVCDEPIVAQEPIEATGHTEVPVIGYGPTCTEPGLTDGTKCSVCGEPVVAQEPIPMDPHDFVDGTCTVCGAPEVYYMLGDVNLDGSVDSMDTNILFRYANGDPTLGELTEVQLQVADVNGDGSVDSMDTNILFRYANGDPTLVWSPVVIVPRRVEV